MEQKSVFALGNADSVNQAIAELPTAKPLKIWTTNNDVEYPDDAIECKNFKAVIVTDKDNNSEIVNCPTNRYQIVQHEQAFRPIVEALTLAGIKNFQFNTLANHKWASLNVFVTGSGYDGVNLGFSVTNSFDSSSAISYGFKATRSTKSIELVGYRQICSNGMKIKVPLNQAEIVKLEIVERVTFLLKEHARILHTKNAFHKIETMQYVTEAIGLLQKPVENMIKLAQKWTIDDNKMFKELIKVHVGRRFARKVEHQYHLDNGNSLWDLYNAMTFVASHDELRPITRESLIDKASDMLNAELFPKIEVVQ